MTQRRKTGGNARGIRRNPSRAFPDVQVVEMYETSGKVRQQDIVAPISAVHWPHRQGSVDISGINPARERSVHESSDELP